MQTVRAKFTCNTKIPSDRLDFHDVGVGSLKDALQAAFEAGQTTGYWKSSNKPSNKQEKST